MQAADVIKLERAMHKIEAGTAAAVRIASQAARKTTEIVERATKYEEESQQLQESKNG